MVLWSGTYIKATAADQYQLITASGVDMEFLSDKHEFFNTSSVSKFTIDSGNSEVRTYLKIIPDSAVDLGSTSERFGALYAGTVDVTGDVNVDQRVNFNPRSAPSSPNEGDVYYDSTAQKLKVYNGSSWETITSS